MRGSRMGKIIVFGAGGRAGRAAVGEAVRRGHHVTAVVRDPDRYRDLEGAQVRLLVGDVTDAEAVADLANGHDAAITAAYDPGAQADVFFTTAAQALLDGLPRAGVDRLVVVGLAAVLEAADGTPLMDSPSFPQEYRPFCVAHAAGTDVLRTSTTALDWLIVSPAGDFDADGEHSGRYSVAAANAASRISHHDFAIALLDEIDEPRHHRTQIGVETA
ncbi:NAD(P)-dependent oxidoreductase [Streptomyces griseosporeus]|uniref:NAD(P)-dependent oxidoreductase n=1 Tax=Streptomyces griseosporeus TaxID=1910 RepID=UPI00167DD342|nr:NAD(P)H-binding protein [Streptomyces griseosporeus]